MVMIGLTVAVTGERPAAWHRQHAYDDVLDEARRLNEQPPAGQAHVGQASVGQALVGQAHVGQAHVGHAPVGQAHVGHAPVGHAQGDHAQGVGHAHGDQAHGGARGGGGESRGMKRRAVGEPTPEPLQGKRPGGDELSQQQSSKKPATANNLGVEPCNSGGGDEEEEEEEVTAPLTGTLPRRPRRLASNEVLFICSMDLFLFFINDHFLSSAFCASPLSLTSPTLLKALLDPWSF